MTSALSVPGRSLPPSTPAVRAALVECPSDGFLGCVITNASNTRIAHMILRQPEEGELQAQLHADLARLVALARRHSV